MVSKKEMMRFIESLDERICDLRYDLNLSEKRYDALLDKYNTLAKVVLKDKATRHKKVEDAPKRKPGRPRKDAGRVDFAKKK